MLLRRLKLIREADKNLNGFWREQPLNFLEEKFWNSVLIFFFIRFTFWNLFQLSETWKKKTKHLIEKILKYWKKTCLQSDLHYPKSSWLIVGPLYMFHKTYEAFHKKHFREFMWEDCTAIEGSGKEWGLISSAMLECLERMYVVAYITVL